MATMKDVADYAGVSVATVSRVMNNTGYVSDDLRERVRRAIGELNYQPSALARSLRRQITQTVGLLIPQLDQPFFSTLAFAIEQTLFAQGYHTLICSAEESAEKEDAYIDMLLSRRVDGTILVPTGHTARHIKHLVEQKVPVVLVDRDLPKLTNIHRVLSNNYQGAYDAMRLLIDLGHRHIGVISGPPHSGAMVQRIRGTKQALADVGRELPAEMLITASQEQAKEGLFRTGYVMAHKLLHEQPQLTAIFALTDVMAIGVLHAAAELEMRLPDDLSVVGFDNIDLAAYSMPELTTVAQPVAEMGATASQILLRQMHSGQTNIESIMLDTTLVIRKSTTKPRA